MKLRNSVGELIGSGSLLPAPPPADLVEVAFLPPPPDRERFAGAFARPEGSALSESEVAGVPFLVFVLGLAGDLPEPERFEVDLAPEDFLRFASAVARPALRAFHGRAVDEPNPPRHRFAAEQSALLEQPWMVGVELLEGRSTGRWHRCARRSSTRRRPPGRRCPPGARGSRRLEQPLRTRRVRRGRCGWGRWRRRRPRRCRSCVRRGTRAPLHRAARGKARIVLRSRCSSRRRRDGIRS